MQWRLAKSLDQLREQVNYWAPERSKVSDGTIGDAAHASRASDHNPWIRDAIEGKGIVSAIDITHDPARGVNGTLLGEQLSKDDRVKYVIFNARIYKSRTGRWEPYHGPNLHKQHIHISVHPVPSLYDSSIEWPIMIIPPTLRKGKTGKTVALLQDRLGLVTTEVFDEEVTEAAVREFQEKHRLDIDGVVGRATWTALH